MRKSVLSLALAAAFAAPGMAAAQAASASPIAGNLSLVSDYRFRGLSQTFGEPALQGGFDYAHSSGFYLGNWNSSISDTLYAGSPLEMDFYAGYKPTFGDVTGDVGILYYYYPGSNAPGIGKIDNTEIYLGAAWKWLSAKYFHAVSDFFGVPDTKNSNYFDFTANFTFGGGWGLIGHVGRQKVKNVADGDYTDYRIAITKDIRGWVLGAAFVDTNAEESVYSPVNARGDSKYIGDSTIVLSVSKTF